MGKLRVRNTGKRPLLQPYSLTISTRTVLPPGFSAALGGTVQFVISCIKGLTLARPRLGWAQRQYFVTRIPPSEGEGVRRTKRVNVPSGPSGRVASPNAT